MAQAPMNAELLRTALGTKGSPARRCRCTNAARTSPPTTSGTRVLAGSQETSVAVISPKVTAARPTDASTTPGTSSGRGSEVAMARGTVSRIKTIVTTTIGTLTQKIVAQPKAD